MDPHCGWCFGFGKVILKIFEHYKNNPSVEFDILPGGLFTRPIFIEKGFAENKRPIAARITELSGVSFSEDYFNVILAEGSFLNSEPPSRAILVFNKLKHKEVILFAERLLTIEFEEAKNNSKEETIFEVLEEFEVDVLEFRNYYESQELKKEVQQKFQMSQNLQTGFPALILRKGKEIKKIAGGYAPFERVLKKIESNL